MSDDTKREDDIEIRTPFGWSIRASGRYITLLVLVIITTGAILFMMREHDLKQTQQFLASAEQLRVATEQRAVQLRDITAQQKYLQDSMDAMIYVLSLEQADRVKLKLDMPVALRIKLLNQERPVR